MIKKSTSSGVKTKLILTSFIFYEAKSRKMEARAAFLLRCTELMYNEVTLQPDADYTDVTPATSHGRENSCAQK